VGKESKFKLDNKVRYKSAKEYKCGPVFFVLYSAPSSIGEPFVSSLILQHAKAC
jgi:hypothetical protein